jgi:hypothetical protein
VDDGDVGVDVRHPPPGDDGAEDRSRQPARDSEAKLDSLLPPQVQWKAHNYNHLHEAPTLFYAVAVVLAIVGHGDGLNATLGWLYAGLRVVHSLVQATVNKVTLRFAVFVASSLVLAGLIARAAIALS